MNTVAKIEIKMQTINYIDKHTFEEKSFINYYTIQEQKKINIRFKKGLKKPSIEGIYTAQYFKTTDDNGFKMIMIMTQPELV